MNKIKKKLSAVNKIGAISYSSFSIKDQTFFAKRLSFLVKAGIPMLESMSLIVAQTKSKSKAKILKRVMADIANGQSLATSLGRFKRSFGNFAINLIKSGESSGNLTQNLSYLADELNKRRILKKKIMSALLYPVIITVATIGITVLLILYVFPKILPIFKSLRAELPPTTRALIWVSDLIKNEGMYILIGLIVFIVSLILIIKHNKKVRMLYDGLIIKIPLFGKIAKNYNLANTTRTFGLLLKSGMPVNEALFVTAETTDNLQYKTAFEKMSRDVIKGKNISEIIKKYPNLFPLMIGHMIAIGEKSGNLSNTLIYLSEYYDNEFQELTKNLSNSIEPVLMVVMGAMVGLVAVSIITPIYGITQHLHVK